MPIYIYNSLTRKKEEFKPIKKNKVSMYVCGPTVYDDSHIGHARGAFVFAVIRNYFRYRGFEVKYVRNVTDVDDKIISKAREDVSQGGDLKKAVKEVARKYLKKYNDDMRALGIDPPDVEPKATEHVEEMLRIITGLLDKDYAYESGGDIYFRVRKFKRYGMLSHQSLEMMESGARVAPGENKEDPLDFALWKRSKEDEPAWKSGSIEGRPGWHIECSAMSMKHLGDNFDIHGGGIDLIFPHHENEIAQSVAYSGRRFANYWMHNGLLTINGRKMAKSLGNYLSISEFLDRHKDPDILKLFFLSAHYRHPVDFTAENIAAAKAAMERFKIFFDKAEAEAAKSPASLSKAVRLMEDHRGILDCLSGDFESAMDDDFNTPLALAALFSAVTRGNHMIASDAADIDEKTVFLRQLVDRIRELGGVLGLSFSGGSMPPGLEKIVKEKLKAREEARKNGDYRLADKIREELKERGVVIEDAKDGTTWRLQ